MRLVMAPSSSWSGRQIFILETGVRVPVVLRKDANQVCGRYQLALKSTKRGCSSVGRAPALQAGGRGFESHQLHNILRDGLEMVPARSHKPDYTGSNPVPATNCPEMIYGHPHGSPQFFAAVLLERQHSQCTPD